MNLELHEENLQGSSHNQKGEEQIATAQSQLLTQIHTHDISIYDGFEAIWGIFSKKHGISINVTSHYIRRPSISDHARPPVFLPRAWSR